jgi:hypothetical protein
VQRAIAANSVSFSKVTKMPPWQIVREAVRDWQMKLEVPGKVSDGCGSYGTKALREPDMERELVEGKGKAARNARWQ